MKVGDYVRTKEGKMGQYIKPDLGKPYITNGIEFYEINESKYSPNLIDLIEEGDYVNGSKVYHKARIDTDDYGNDFKEVGVESDTYLYHWVEEKDIKSIVTKEQFESMKYKVGE